MKIRTEPYTLLQVRRMARRLWQDPEQQRKWLRAFLRCRGWGGLLIEGAPARTRK